MRKLLAVLLAVTLAGCAADAPRAPSAPGDFSELWEAQKTLLDGRVITCIVYEDGWAENGGVSCDWQRE